MTERRRRPNVLWLFCDQLRYHALSCSGDPNIRTPAVDRLAAEGARFTNAVSQYPVCMPFRAGLITGQYAHVNGVRVHGDMLAPTDCTVARAFIAAGYRTSWVGKWHLASQQGVEGWSSGADYWVHPYLRAGFEDWYGFELSNHFYRTRYCHGEGIWPPIELEGFQTDALTDLSLGYLSETASGLDQPWFHCLSVEAPHPGTGRDGQVGNPAPPEYEARFRPEDIQLRPNTPETVEQKARKQQAGYYAQVANLDDNVGRVLDYLDESGQAENTLVVFFSDHGEMGGSHGRFHKGVVEDESTHIPLIMRLPGVIPENTVVDDPISGVDIFPTCAGMCEAPIPPEVQGMDLSLRTRGLPGPTQSEALIQWLGKARYGFGDWQYRAIRTRRHTYCVSDDRERCALYDNEKDPYQMDNLFDSPDADGLRRELHARLRNAVVRSGEEIPNFVIQAEARADPAGA